MENTIIVAAGADEAAPVKFLAPYAGAAMAEHFLYDGERRAVRLRRPHQARVRLPPDVAAAAPPAGSRGLPGRRLLPAQPPARARGQAQRRPRRRLDDRAADHRDAGRRRVGLHPDERHLDHRRPDLPRAEALLLGRAAGHQRRHLGVARRRQRADQADEEGRRAPEARAVAVPRPRGVRAVRLRPRRRHAGDAGPRRAARQDAQPERALADGRRGAGRRHLRRDQRLPRPHLGRPRAGVPRGPRRADARRERRRAREDRRRASGTTTSSRPSTTAVEEFAKDFGEDIDEDGVAIDVRAPTSPTAVVGSDDDDGDDDEETADEPEKEAAPA